MHGRVALVTGASRGIGRAVALALAREGARLALGGRNARALAATAADAEAAGSAEVRTYTADLASGPAVESMCAQLGRDFDGLDVLVHSAAVIATGAHDASSIDDFDRQYSTNVRAPYLLTQRLLPHLRARRGQVVFVNSTAALRTSAGAGQYAATKQALRAIADTLREEVNRDGVRVLTMFLGRTATPMQQALHQAEGKCYHAERLIQPEDVAGVMLALLKLPATAEVTDVVMRPMMKALEA
jgi:NAD(P)-dependent dehydrogenase (short-subunit alcohol dehydrogenase family)